MFSQAILLAAFTILAVINSQCPHLAGRRASAVNAAPGSLPPSAHPLPYFIQTSFIHHFDPDDSFAHLVVEELRKLRTRLAQQTMLTLDNQNIACKQDSEEERCRDFSALKRPFHLLSVEDSKKGAAVYSLEADLNGLDSAKIEAALLDALSRHSLSSLAGLASPPAAHSVGFVRELTLSELAAASSPSSPSPSPPLAPPLAISPLRLSTIDTSLLQLRNPSGLEVQTHRLRELTSEDEMDSALALAHYLILLFWSQTDPVSLHAFSLFANLSVTIDEELAENKKLVLASVACHSSADFCSSLSSRDLHSLVAFRNGIKVASLEEMADVDFYSQWLDMILAGGPRRVGSGEDMKRIKKGWVDGRRVPSITVGVFPSEDDQAFRHFQAVSDHLLGQYFLFYFIKTDISVPVISTYRNGEKKKRHDFIDEFNPHSIASFIVSSSLPSIVNMTGGLSSSAILRSRAPLAVLLSPSSFDSSSFAFFAVSTSSLICGFIHEEGSRGGADLVRTSLALPEGPHLVLFDKEKVWHLELDETNTSEEISEWLKATREMEPDLLLSPFGVHPLRNLQLAHVNRVFGTQQVELPADPSLLTPLPTQMDALSSLRAASSSEGGCPFMRSPSSGHSEL